MDGDVNKEMKGREKACEKRLITILKRIWYVGLFKKTYLSQAAETPKYGENQWDTIISRCKVYRKDQEECYENDVALYIKENIKSNIISKI